MPWIIPITDRTQNDVISHTIKGYINADDLNRIEGNEAYLAEIVNVNLVTPITTWQYTDIIYEHDYTRICTNCSILKSCVPVQTLDVPQPPYNTWTKYNQLEQIIEDLYHYINARTASYFYCGELCLGQQIGVL